MTSERRHLAHIPAVRIAATYGLLGVLLVVFVARLYQLQVLDSVSYLDAADENRFSSVSLPAPRGVIYDRNGFQLVRNIPIYNVVVTPADLPDSEAETEVIYQRLSALTGIPADLNQDFVLPEQGCPETAYGLRQAVQKAGSILPYKAWQVVCDVSPETARIVMQQAVDMPGVSIETLPARDYTTGALTSAVIGYLGPIPEAQAEDYRARGFVLGRDKVGYSGIELEYQDDLAGKNGQKLVERDVAGQAMREVGEVRQPVPGQNLRLTLDTRLQAAAVTALRTRMEFMNRVAGEIRVPLGAVIAMNPQTGEILAMVSLPTYENNRLARFIPADYYAQLEGDTRGRPLINHAIMSEFPPGSTFKLVTAVGALQEGVITPTQLINDPGKITIVNRYFPNDPGRAKDFVCWKPDGHGPLDLVHGLAFSCNVYFYKVGGGFENEVPGDGLNINRIGEYARAIGYGAPLGIDLQGENDGLIPDPDWKRRNLGESWSTGDTYNAATGQGFVLATPLQVLNEAVVMATGGKVIKPYIVSEVLDGEGNVVQKTEPTVRWNLTDGVITPGTPDVLVQPWVIQLVQQGMHLVTTEGTAHGYADLDTISSAGKTGTGEYCDTVANDKGLCIPGNWPTHGWYVAYAPFENPEIAVVAFIYNGGEGAVTAGPIVKQILEAYFNLKAIDAAR
jgi:penicillin-binding protein 2